MLTPAKLYHPDISSEMIPKLDEIIAAHYKTDGAVIPVLTSMTPSPLQSIPFSTKCKIKNIIKNDIQPSNPDHNATKLLTMIATAADINNEEKFANILFLRSIHGRCISVGESDVC